MSDDLIGILFYILIIVIGGVISALRNRSKKKKMTTAPVKPLEDSVPDEVPPAVYDPFEELTRRFEFKIEEPAEDTVSEPEITLQPDVVSLETIADTPEEEGIPVFEETRETLLSDSEEDNLKQADSQITDSQISDQQISEKNQERSYINLAENIKQGIIYSEILKRKHF